MTIYKQELSSKVDELFGENFVEIEVTTVPEISDSRLTHGATGLSGEFVYLYVDIRESSTLPEKHRIQTVSKIYKAFHHCMVEIIKDYSGKVRSFDGDRVMGIFDGAKKINNSIEAAMKMVGCLLDVLNPKISEYYKDETFEIGIGISTGNVMFIKAGVGYDENNRDIVSIGNAANFAAKLSDTASSTGRIWICEACFNRLLESNRYTTDKNGNKVDMWLPQTLNFADIEHNVYSTHWYLHPK